jgi:butyrate kinase
MQEQYRILAINPGSTSTKVALFINDRELFSANIAHDAATLGQFAEINQQFDYRKQAILGELAKAGIALETVDAFVGRGGSLAALKSGVYAINPILLHHAKIGLNVKHPAMLGSQLAQDFAQTYGVRAFIVNPPDVDEFDDLSRITGLADVYRDSRIHALNQKEVGLRFAASINRNYAELNLIITHIGGGISVTAHRRGLMVDSNDIVNGDGPMAPTRAGALPANAVIKLCYSGKYTEKEMYNRITKNGGLVDHLGTSDVREVIRRIKNGDAYAKLVYDAMIYQISKNIGAYAVTLKGDVAAIILTGGIVRDQYLVEQITAATKWIAPIVVMVGEFEMEALAGGVWRALTGREPVLEYTGEPVWKGFGR